jgi:protein phosphatase
VSELLTIGAFARAARLSPKALRLYDELGLLPPAAVDAGSGYRYYRAGQLERARLIAWLRQLGMPLARIRTVLAGTSRDGASLDVAADAAAAAEVDAYWQEILAETATRQRLATFLVDYLSGRGTTMTGSTLGIRYAARTDQGLVRTSNQDTAYAGSRLLAVADGMSGVGDRASAAAIEALKPLETTTVPTGELLNALAEAVGQAQEAVREVASSASDGDAGTTLTAILWSGSQLGLVHIGDSRAYVLREGELFRITHDHTYVQSLVDEGRLTPDEAASHPDRALLLKAITGSGGASPDLSVHDAHSGDRYLLCSDGLSAVVAPDALRAALAGDGGPEPVLEALVALAYEAGAPDNIACVVADVVAV